MEVNWQIIINVAVGVLMPLVVFALGYIVSLSKRVSDLRVLISDEFVRKPELVEVKQLMQSINATCNDLMKTLAEMKGEFKAGQR